MSVTFDFKIVSSNLSGISVIEAQNEDAFVYLQEEAHMTIFPDGSSVLFDERVGDFINDCEHAHLSCTYN
jgi:hypothetical protein